VLGCDGQAIEDLLIKLPFLPATLAICKTA